MAFYRNVRHAKTLFMGGVAVVGAGAAIYAVVRSTWFSDRKAELVSELATRTAEEPVLPADLLRSQFTATPLIQRKPVPDHTHGPSAAFRSTASSFFDEFARNTGLGVYFVQCSRADQRVGRMGSRTLHWAKDLTVTVARYDPPPDALLAFVDVDYYINMPHVLSSEFKPTLLYTFTPDGVAKEDGEFSYTFDRNNCVDYRVAGGGCYSHEVWNYGTDQVLTVRKFLGIPYQVAAYLVDKRAVDKSHSVILLTPLRRWTGISALLGYMLQGRELERLKPVEGDFLRMRVQKSDGLYVSTGEVGKYSCATIRVRYDDAIAISASTTTVKLSLPTVLQYIEGDDLKDRKAAASALLKYYRFRNEKIARSNAIVFPVEESVRSYDYGVLSFDPDAKRLIEPFMAPLLHGAFAPSLSLANEERAIAARVKAIAVKPGSLQLTEFMLRAMNEFCELLLPSAGTMLPATLDEVYERQSRPAQRAILDRSVVEGRSDGIKSFVKREAYGRITDPRIISTLSGAVKREYSQFIYPIADHLKTQEWYAFGKSPRAIAERVTDVLQDASSAVNTDFSRFDGRVSDLLRMLERKILIRAYGHQYAHEVTELHNSQFNQTAFCTLGTRYETGTSRASGSPETAAFNSIANAFTAFLTFRMTRENGGFIAPEIAWSRLGVYGGDDGLTADVDTAKYIRASASLGLKLEVELVVRGCGGITFLSRKYTPQVWFGDPNSCCDLPRQLSKFHTTVSLDPRVTPIDKLLEKSRAFYLTDRNTPVLGEFVSQVLAIYGATVVPEELTRPMRAWNSELPQSEQYPNAPCDWFDHYASESLGIYGFDFDLFNTWLDGVESLEDFCRPPLCAEPKEPEITVPMVVDGDVKEPSVNARSEAGAKPKGRDRRSRPKGRRKRARPEGNAP